MAYYRVDQKGVEEPRLIKAATPAAALRHVSANAFTVSKPLSTDDVVELTSTGVKIEKVGPEEEAQAEAEQAQGGTGTPEDGAGDPPVGSEERLDDAPKPTGKAKG